MRAFFRRIAVALGLINRAAGDDSAAKASRTRAGIPQNTGGGGRQEGRPEIDPRDR